MTERLYYTDPTILNFSAKIISIEKNGDLYHTILDQSAFYPTSGGQFHDRGLLNNIAVDDVLLDENSQVVHISQQPTGETGQEIKGEVEPVRRNDNCQKHSAQHIISQAFVQLFNFETVSVHLGDDYAAIELDDKEISAEQMNQAETLANNVIANNHPIKISFVSQAEAKNLPLRKIPEREGKIRIIQIGQFDYSACGGTHCCNSAEVGLIKLIGSEKARGHTLVKFLAGRLAIEDYQKRFEIINNLANQFTCHFSDLPEKFQKIDSDNRKLKKEVLSLNNELIPIKAKTMANQSQPCGSTTFLFESVSIADPKQLSSLATTISYETCGVVFLMSFDRMVISVANGTKFKAGDIARLMADKFNLKGGGSPTVAQLAGLDQSSIDAYKEFLWETIESA